MQKSLIQLCSVSVYWFSMPDVTVTVGCESVMCLCRWIALSNSPDWLSDMHSQDGSYCTPARSTRVMSKVS